MSEETIYEIPGEQIQTLESFYEVIGQVINGPGGYFGDNLDAFIDCLRGEFGTPDDFTLKWVNSNISKKNLGYKETVRQLEIRLKRAHPSNKKDLEKQIENAKQKMGPTVFD